jgi:hypothetical protein
MLLLWIVMDSDELAEAKRLAEEWREAQPAVE